MTDKETSNGEKAGEEQNDEEAALPAEEEPSDLQLALQRAEQFHSMMDDAKDWAQDTSSDIERQAYQGLANDDVDGSEHDQLLNYARMVGSVYRRIEHGDRNSARGG